MADSVKDIKISKIQTSDGEQHEINAKYWGGLETTDFYDLKNYVDQIVSGGIKFRGVFGKIPSVEYDEETDQYITHSDGVHDIIWNVGDIIIVTSNCETLGEPTKEYILTSDGDGLPVWVKLGDVSATDQRLTDIEEELSKRITTNAENIIKVDNKVVIVKGGKDNSAVLKGEYEGYSNQAISQVSVAVGAASTSGLKGWYYDAITFDDTNKVYKIYIKYQNEAANGTGIITSNNTTTQPKLISTSSGSTNSSFKSGYEVGDVISLVNDKKYEDCSTITAINGNVLTVDKLPFAKSDMKTSSLASVVGYEAIDEFSIYCIKRDFNDELKILTLSKYDNGDVDFGGGSLSEGVQTYAVNIGAHAEGAQTVAKGQYSHAEGIRTIANYASHAEGSETIASGSRCHAEGYKNEASGDFSHAEGDNNVASGVSSHAEGYNTRATNNQSHAEGGSTNATGKQSHAEGWSTTASGLHAHAEGGYTIASAWNSHAGGNYSEANGNNSFAHGDHVNTTNINEVAFGQYNKSESDTLFSIGNGTDENNRSNILEVKSIEPSNIEYEYSLDEGDIIFYHNEIERIIALRAVFNSRNSIYGEYIVTYFEPVYTYNTSNYGNNVYNFIGENIADKISIGTHVYVPISEKPDWEIEYGEANNDDIDMTRLETRCLYISTDFTAKNAIAITDNYDWNHNNIWLKAQKITNSSLFVNGKRVLIEGDIKDKNWIEDINVAKEQSITESNAYTDSKIFISRNTSSTGIIDTGCIYKGEEFKNVAKGCGSVAIGAGVLSKSDGAITLGWSDTKTVSSDSTLSTNDDYLNKWKELTNVTDETIGSTTQAGFSASLGNNSVSLGRNNLSIGPQSTAIGMRNLSIGNHAVALGGYNIARGHDSVAMGQGCITNNTGSGSSNRGEFACGRFNKSVSDTQFSLGIGTSVTKRKNALEIKTNGKHYIYGVGGYDGTNPNSSNDIATVLSNISKDIGAIKPSNMVEIDYNGLKSLRDSSQLIPGQQYRITDYITTTSQKYTCSAEHQFDIIVTALNEKTLSEEAKAIQHEGDDYFANSNLSAWKIWYSLDNDTNRFSWAGKQREEVCYESCNIDTSRCVLTIPSNEPEDDGKRELKNMVRAVGTIMGDPTTNGWCDPDKKEIFSHYSYEEDNNGVMQLTLHNRLVDGDLDGDYTLGGFGNSYHYNGTIKIERNEYSVWREYMGAGNYGNREGEKIYLLTDKITKGNIKRFDEVIDETVYINPKGVIYRMIDEWNNDCPYDFKNIMFNRIATHNGCLATGSEFEGYNNVFCYTFGFYDGDTYVDASVFGNATGDSEGVYNNIIKTFNSLEYGENDDSILDSGSDSGSDSELDDHISQQYIQQSLNNIVFMMNILNYEYYTCRNNIFGEGCRSNTFGNYCRDNTFGNYCENNTFGDYCDSNTFGNYCYDNTFGESCGSNIFGDYCRDNTFGDYCEDNTFGNNCNGNIFGNNCESNIFGNSFWINTFGNDCYNNTFENYYSNNIISDGYRNNHVLKSDIISTGDITAVDINATNITASSISSKGTINSDGNITSKGNITSTGTMTSAGFYQSSDERLKTFTSDYDINLDDIKNIKTGKFYWNSDEDQTINGGVSAQTVEEYFPELVKEDETGMKSVNYDGLAVVAIAAIKKLTERIEQLEEIVRNK